MGSGTQPIGQTSWLLPCAQVAGVQPLLPDPCGTQITLHDCASAPGLPPLQLTAAAAPIAPPMTVNASTAGMRSSATATA
jgi:hypothetical protein